MATSKLLARGLRSNGSNEAAPARRMEGHDRKAIIRRAARAIQPCALFSDRPNPHCGDFRLRHLNKTNSHNMAFGTTMSGGRRSQRPAVSGQTARRHAASKSDGNHMTGRQISGAPHETVTRLPAAGYQIGGLPVCHPVSDAGRHGSMWRPPV